MKDNTAQSLREIVARIDQILGEAQTAYTHEVNALIHENCSDPERIEHLLDGLLDFCFDPKMLGLYKKVCRRYFDINPEATVDYVKFYREFWDSDGNTFR